jgi:hypothetical protein
MVRSLQDRPFHYRQLSISPKGAEVGQPAAGQFVIYQDIAKVAVQTYFLPSYYSAIGSGIPCLLPSIIHGWVPIRLHRKGIEKGDGNGI